MERRGWVVCFCLFVALLLSLSFVSAFSFGGFSRSIFGGEDVKVGPVFVDTFGYWKFDGNYSDSSWIGGSNGVGVGGASITGGALNSTGGYAQVSSGSVLSVRNPLTISLWIRPFDLGHGGILLKGRYGSLNGDQGDYVLITAAGKLTFGLNFRDSDSSSVSTLSPGRWYHVAVSYNGTSQKMYINGVLEGSKAYNKPISLSSNPLYIGVYYDGRYKFNGLIDEVAVYNRSLSDSEVFGVFNEQKGMFGDVTPPTATCIDSDGGINTGVKGFVTTNDIWNGKSDVCSSTVRNIEYTTPSGCIPNATQTCGVYETFCNNSKYFVTNFACPNGCSDGACLPAIADVDGCPLLSDAVKSKISQQRLPNGYMDYIYGSRLIVREGEMANQSDYIIVSGGSVGEDRLLRVMRIYNQTTGYSNDQVTFTDVLSGYTLAATLTNEGVGTVTIGPKVYGVNYYGPNDLSDDAKTLTLDYPSTNSTQRMMFDCDFSQSNQSQLACSNFGFQSGTVGGCCDANCTRRDLSGCYIRLNSCADRDANLDFLHIFSNVSAGVTTHTGASCLGGLGGGGGGVVRSDFCANETALSEAECTAGNISIHRNYSCLNGCLDGVCVAGPGVTCTSGCEYNDKCIPFGIRVGGNYCDIDGTMKVQNTRAGAACENNYECRSNSCANGKCIEVSSGFQRFVVNILCAIAHPFDSVARQQCVDGFFGGTLVGETFPLFTGGSKLRLGSSLSSVKSVILKSDMPNLLTFGTVGGVNYVQSIQLGSDTLISFTKQPTSFTDPVLGVSLPVSSDKNVYSSVVDFSRAVNFISLKGSEITLFGKEYVVDSETSLSRLVLRPSDGSDELVFENGGAVLVGLSRDMVDGTLVRFIGGVDSMIKLSISVRAPSSDGDSINVGTSFVDPVFGTFKIDFASTMPSKSDFESIQVYNNGDDKLMVQLSDYRGISRSFNFVVSRDDYALLNWDSDGHRIHVVEGERINKSDYVVVGNEDEGRLMKVTTITNQTTGYSNDKVTFTDVFDGTSVDATLTNDGVGTVTIGGKVYGVSYYGANDIPDNAKTIRIDYPDSLGSDVIIYPTIQTKNGAKVAFYEPVRVSAAVRVVLIPNGAGGYYRMDIFALGGVVSVEGTGLRFGWQRNGLGDTDVYLVDSAGAMIGGPALIIYEGRDDNLVRNNLIVLTESGATAYDGVGVSDVVRTWANDLVGGGGCIALYSDSHKCQKMDRWGSLVTIDSIDSDQKTATIEYPSEQLSAEVYISSVTSSSSSGGGGGSSG